MADEGGTATEYAVVPVAEAETPTESKVDLEGSQQQTAEELVAKAIVPVKKEFLRPPPIRPCDRKDEDLERKSNSSSSNVLKEKKSKRQLKRERKQEQKSPLNLCPEVAKTGDVSSCRYNNKCRFSHDLEAFKAQKPDDLEGDCPFLSSEGPCPFGLACRFSGTHKDSFAGGISNPVRRSSEVNGLNKDFQKLLWKNKMKFPKADAQLKLLGLLGPAKSELKKLENKEEGNQALSNGCHATGENGCREAASPSVYDTVDASGNNEHVEGTSVADEIEDDSLVNNEGGPLKKAKSLNEECSSFTEVNNGGNHFGQDPGHISAQIEEASSTDNFAVRTDIYVNSHQRERKLIDFRGKLYLAPLTTVGNLPFRRLCKVLGADVTCGEMAMCTNLLQGQASEWALVRRHSAEDLFGVQICGSYPDTVARTVELIQQECAVDFIDINMGCPIDIVVNRGAGSFLLTKPTRMKGIIQAASGTVDTPITVKVRTAYFEGRNRVDSIVADIGDWGASAVTIHGRSRQQRYSKLADWDYIYQCARRAPKTLQVLGNGDIFSYLDWNKHQSDCPELTSCMIARGALIKPWLFTEIKEQRHWDISSGERLDILKNYAKFGLEHWGSDSKGVETTRHFLLEWLSYTCRYVPVGLLDVIPQCLNWRPPSYFGRNDLETLMASDSAADWIKISEMLLGKVPAGFTFAPKHKSNAYDRAENG
ncbi:Zinc finger, CCCH-type [Dillenia turbinata]|uniref:tRNA-dihydrouridine(47) synthase [NAD(P)(+)] n=1 Tax=Dillenia turbinata TaxID=194707 RepID=A0AAN8YXL6_9MAGN